MAARRRVLHVTYAVARGGIETWLCALLRQPPLRDMQFTLAYHRLDSAAMAGELREAGVELVRLPGPRRPRTYRRALDELLRERQPLAAVHTHVNFPGIVLQAARRAGVPVRIAQSHVAPALATRGLIAGTYVRFTNRWFRDASTVRIAVSEPAVATLFGRRPPPRYPVILLPCGIDIHDQAEAASAVPAVPEGSGPTLAIVGRLSPEKNHGFAFRVLRSLQAEFPALRLLVIGAGEERAALEAAVQRLGIEGQVLFLGERRDVPALLRSSVDVLLLPSLTEGASITVLEGQAAGVPCVVSPAVCRESVLSAALVRVLALDVGAWVEAIADLLRRGPAPPAPARIAGTTMDIRYNARVLAALYAGETPRDGLRHVDGSVAGGSEANASVGAG